MQKYKDNCQVTDGNAAFDLSVFTTIGDRADQQDSFDFELKNQEGLIVICDGMGGLNGGRAASAAAADTLVNAYNHDYPFVEPVAFIQNGLYQANQNVLKLKSSDGTSLNAGSTVVCLLIQNHFLYWGSVGDSRAYLLRNGEFVQITQDHNYHAVLQQQLNTGLIDSETYRRESKKSEALISYLGIPELRLIDHNLEPLSLQKNDLIVSMSDGLYKILHDSEIKSILENFLNITDALQALEKKVQRAVKNTKIKRDNMTVALIKVK